MRLEVDGPLRRARLLSKFTKLRSLRVESLDDPSGLLALEPLEELRIRKRGKLTAAQLDAIAAHHPGAELPALP